MTPRPGDVVATVAVVSLMGYVFFFCVSWCGPWRRELCGGFVGFIFYFLFFIHWLRTALSSSALEN